MTAFAKALEGTNSLITFSSNFRGITKEGGWDTLSNTLCDTSSLESIYNSNHTLVDCISLFDGMDERVNSHLELNKCKKKLEVVHKKIIHHLSDGENTTNLLHELMDMKLEVLPLLFSWVGRSNAGFQLLY